VNQGAPPRPGIEADCKLRAKRRRRAQRPDMPHGRPLPPNRVRQIPRRCDAPRHRYAL